MWYAKRIARCHCSNWLICSSLRTPHLIPPTLVTIKMNRIISILLVFISAASLGQVSGIYDIADTTIKKNKVYRCSEYQICSEITYWTDSNNVSHADSIRERCTDQASFYKKRKNGFYQIFDKNGRLIEQNYYDDLHEMVLTGQFPEFINYFIYDVSGGFRAKIEYDPNGICKINKVMTAEFDSLNKNTYYRNIEQNGTLESYNSKKIPISNREKWLKNSDSIEAGNSKIIHTVELDNKDTMVISFSYYSRNRLDSIVQLNPKSKDISRSKFIYTYKNEALQKKEYIIYFDGNQATWIDGTNYSENGLPIEDYHRELYHNGSFLVICRVIYNYEFYTDE